MQVDKETHTLRLIDFGSAVDMTECIDSQIVTTTAVYSTPDQTEQNPDVFSAALVWLRMVVPALASKRAFDEFRRAVIDTYASGQEPDAGGWVICRGVSSNPFRWVETEHGCLASELLRSIIDPDPARRLSADEALADPYLAGYI